VLGGVGNFNFIMLINIVDSYLYCYKATWESGLYLPHSLHFARVPQLINVCNILSVVCWGLVPSTNPKPITHLISIN